MLPFVSLSFTSLDLMFDNLVLTDTKICVISGDIYEDSVLNNILNIVNAKQEYSIAIINGNPGWKLEKNDCKINIWLDDHQFLKWSQNLAATVTNILRTKITFVLTTKFQKKIKQHHMLKGVNVPLTSNLYFVIKEANNAFEVYEVYNEFTEEVQLSKVCAGSKLLPCNPVSGMLDRRKDLTNVHIKAVIEYYPPLAMYDKEDLTVKPWGLFPEVFLEIKKTLNATFSLE